MLLLVLMLLRSIIEPQAPADAPRQPIPFSHRQHAGTLKLKCRMCHQAPAQAEDVIALPTAGQCMQCHSAIKTESPAIRKLAAAAKEGKEIEWAPVYQLAEDVKFNHKSHLEKNTACATCHGRVEEREQLYREVNLSMGACMDCHRANRAAIACPVCHDRKP